MACCRGKSLTIKSMIRAENVAADTTMIKHGIQTLNFNGSDSVFSWPHTLGSLPDSISVTLLSTSDNAVLDRTITRDATNIIIEFAVPPAAGSINVSWQVFKG